MSSTRRMSVGLRGWRKLKDDAAIIVLFLGRFEIEIRQRDFAGVSRRQVKKRSALDGIVSDLQLAAILENEESRCG